MNRWRRYAWLIFVFSLNPLSAHAASDSSGTEEQRIIVKWKDDGRSETQALSAIRQRVRSASGIDLQQVSSLGSRRAVLRSQSNLSQAELNRALDDLNAQSDVEYAVLDQRRRAHAVTPNDPYFTATSGRTGQWYLQASEPAALNVIDAWDVTRGSGSVVVAVLDTGVRFDHPDLSGKLLSGYDFVSGESTNSFLTANDGNGWDSDASDPGDWVSASDRQQSTFRNCDESDSSWHGTRVSGLIGAGTDNAIGIAGTGWTTVVLPVRVLGKCGGWDSDILAGMRWAAGLGVSGVATNTHPAQVINLSLGGSGTCSTAYQDVIDELWAAGVIVVASAGNDGGPVNAPANCENVVAVAGVRHEGDKVGYSSLGREITIAAPAGNCVNTGEGDACLYSLDTTSNTGTTSPSASSYTDQTNYNLGTSFSAPLVSGVVALMYSANPYLDPEATISALSSSAAAFPSVSSTTCHVPTGTNDIQNTQCNCTTSTCGAGMLNAQAAVSAALSAYAGDGYIVGGTVSGLSGNGLVLSNNGESLAVQANGYFNFSTRASSGSTYNVTVQTQPADPAQTCTVSNGTGTVGSANVTAIEVNCTTNAYTVGGTVSGLSGTGLVLQNNGGNDLAITANGSFTFANSIANGGAYSVTIKTQPSNPTQSCSIANASGTVANANVTNLAVTCASVAAASGATADAGSGGGGGGQLGLRELLLMCLLLCWMCFRPRRALERTHFTD